MKLVNDAVDLVRRSEAKSKSVLKGSRFLWLKNPDNLTAAQRAELAPLSQANLKTAFGIKSSAKRRQSSTANRSSRRMASIGLERCERAGLATSMQ